LFIIEYKNACQFLMDVDILKRRKLIFGSCWVMADEKTGIFSQVQNIIE